MRACDHLVVAITPVPDLARIENQGINWSRSLPGPRGHLHTGRGYTKKSDSAVTSVVLSDLVHGNRITGAEGLVEVLVDCEH
jgi:hypothetical protein